MMTRNVLLNMELEEDDDEDGDIGECPGAGARGSGIRGGRLCAEAATQKQLGVFFLRSLRTVLRDPCPRVLDTPDPVRRRPLAAPHAGPAHSPALARRDTNKRAGEAGAGRRRAEDGGPFPPGLLLVKLFLLTASKHFTK